MADPGDVIRITDIQSFAGKSITNVYHYQLNDAAELVAIAVAFTDDLINECVKVQSSFLSHTQLLLQNINNDLEFLSYTPGGVVDGLRAGETYPSFVAWKFRLVRATRATRHGHKRIAGIVEGDANGNQAAPAIVADLNNLATAMSQNLFWGLGQTATPVILGTPPPVGPVAINYISTVLFEGVTSQVSRK